MAEEEKKPWTVFKFNEDCKTKLGCKCCGYFHGPKDDKRNGLKIEYNGNKVVTKVV